MEERITQPCKDKNDTNSSKSQITAGNKLCSIVFTAFEDMLFYVIDDLEYSTSIRGHGLAVSRNTALRELLFYQYHLRSELLFTKRWYFPNAGSTHSVYGGNILQW